MHDHRFTKIEIYRVGMVKNGYDQSGHEALKLIVSQKWTNGINWFFVWWCKFRKTASWFSDYLVGMAKKGIYLKNEFMNWADFFNADIDAVIFGQTDIPLSDLFKCWGSTVVVLVILWTLDRKRKYFYIYQNELRWNHSSKDMETREIYN